METSIMARFQQMAEFMNHDMFNTPIGQQQQIIGIADAAFFHVAHTPPRLHRFIANRRRPDIHHLCITMYHRLHQLPKLFRCLHLLSLCGQWQLMEECCSLVLSLSSLFPCLNNPVAVSVNKRLYFFSRHTNGSRHMHIPVSDDAHRQPSCPSVCHLYSHQRRLILSNTSKSAGSHFTLSSSFFASHLAASCSFRCSASVSSKQR